MVQQGTQAGVVIQSVMEVWLATDFGVAMLVFRACYSVWLVPVVWFLGCKYAVIP